MNKFFLVFGLFLYSALSAAECVPAKETVDVKYSGQYHRIHPSGNYFLFTSGQTATIVDVTDRQRPKTIQTSMSLEAYPVEATDGGWSMIAAPANGGGRGPNGGMNFFKFADVISDKAISAKPIYTDSEFGEWYHSIAELPDSTSTNKKVRMLLYSQRRYKDYDMKMNSNGTVASAKTLKTGQLCDNIFKPLIKTKEQNEAFHKAQVDINKLRSEYNIARAKSEAEKVKELDIEIKKMIEQSEADYYGKDYVANQKKQVEVQAEISELRNKLNSEMKEINDKKRVIEDEYRKKYSELDFRNTAEYKEKIKNIRDEYERVSSNRSLSQEVRQRQLDRINKEYVDYSTEVSKKSSENPELKKLSDDLKAQDQIIADFIKSSTTSKKFNEALELRQSLQTDQWILKDGKQFANPVLSKDGTYVAGLVGSKLQIFKINADGNCELAGQADHRGSKVSFSYPENGKLPKVTYTAEGGSADFQRKVVVYDLEKKSTTVVSGDDKGAYYPGFTKDGRIMYKTETGISIVDPNQTSGNKESCIQASSSGSSSSTATPTKKGNQ